MGGNGSGYPLWRRKKAQTEQCLVLSLHPLSASELTIQCRNSAFVAWTKHCRWPHTLAKGPHRFIRKLPIQYAAVSQGQWHTVDLIIILQASQIQSGGLRWWFRCPFECGRKSARLYL